MNFKIGDKVKVNKWVGGIPKDFNGIGEVISINTKSPYPIRVNIGYDVDYGFLESELELYKEEEKMVKFNVEDKVLVKDGNGEIRMVRKWIMTREGTEFYLDDNKGPYKSTELELYKEVEGDKMSKFKVGDKVRIVKMEKEILEEVNIGDVGTILKMIDKNYDFPITVQIDRIDDYFDFRETELELYKEEYKGLTINNDEIVVKDLVSDKCYSLNSDGMNEIKEDKMEKTFKEVIDDIKEGEAWESEYKTILKTKDMILISDKNGCRLSTFGFCDNKKFKLKRKEYTFAKAFKSYEIGERIESVESGVKYQRKRLRYNTEITDCCFELDKWEETEDCPFTFEELRGKWYIN